MDQPIYVVISSDDLPRMKKNDPQRKPNPIVWETGCALTLEQAHALAARVEAQGYGPCRVGRVVFDGLNGDDKPTKTIAQLKEEIDAATSAETATLVIDQARGKLTPADVEELAQHHRMAWG